MDKRHFGDGPGTQRPTSRGPLELQDGSDIAGVFEERRMNAGESSGFFATEIANLRKSRAASFHLSNGRGIDDGDGVALEVVCIEGEEPHDAVGLHRGDEAGIIRFQAFDRKRLHECVPRVKQICAVE